MAEVISPDGTVIQYRRTGSGPAVVLVGGGLDDGAENEPLALGLAGDFTAYNYARRGRDGSGDTAPYAVEREIEDLNALLDVTGPAHVCAVSSGGALALRAAAAQLPIVRLAVYEVPYLTDEPMITAWNEYAAALDTALAADRRDDALALFMRLAGSSDDDIAAAQDSRYWPRLRALAPTLAYDAACLGDGKPPVELLRHVAQPVLVATGGAPDPDLPNMPAGVFEAAADVLATEIPRAQRGVLTELTHAPDPVKLAPALHDFFTQP